MLIAQDEDRMTNPGILLRNCTVDLSRGGGSNTRVTGSLFYRYCNNPNPFLLLTLGLSATLRQCFRPKDYTTTIFRLKVSISKGLGCSSICKTMTRDPRFRPAIQEEPTSSREEPTEETLA